GAGQRARPVSDARGGGGLLRVLLGPVAGRTTCLRAGPLRRPQPGSRLLLGLHLEPAATAPAGIAVSRGGRTRQRSCVSDQLKRGTAAARQPAGHERAAVRGGIG